MRLIDKDYRLFGVVNIIDLVVALVVIGVLALAARVLFGVQVTPALRPAEDRIEMVVRATQIQIAVDPMVSRGDPVARLGGAGVMGTLESWQVLPSRIEAPDGEGGFRVVESAVLRDYEFVIRGTGTFDDKSVSMGTEQVRQYQQMDLLLPRFQMPVRVVEIRKVD